MQRKRAANFFQAYPYSLIWFYKACPSLSQNHLFRREKSVLDRIVQATSLCHWIVEILNLLQRCGVRLFDDFIELESGSVKELEIELQELGRSTQRTRNLGKSIFEVFGALWRPTDHNLQKQRLSNSYRGNMLPLEEIRQPPNALYRSNAAQQPSQPSQPSAKCQDTLRLLLCVDKRKSGTPLHQEHIDSVSIDREPFLFLRSKYFGHWNVRNWFTLRTIGSLSLSRVCIFSSSYLSRILRVQKQTG